MQTSKRKTILAMITAIFVRKASAALAVVALLLVISAPMFTSVVSAAATCAVPKFPNGDTLPAPTLTDGKCHFENNNPVANCPDPYENDNSILGFDSDAGLSCTYTPTDTGSSSGSTGGDSATGSSSGSSSSNCSSSSSSSSSSDSSSSSGSSGGDSSTGGDSATGDAAKSSSSSTCGTAKCAVYGFGPVECPPGDTYKNKNDCFVINLAEQVAPGQSPQYKKDAGCAEYKKITGPAPIACNSGEGETATTSSTSSSALLNKSNCDPALSCQQNAGNVLTGSGTGGDTNTATSSSNAGQSGVACDVVALYVNPLVKAVAALVGVGVVLGIVIGAIQYATSADDPGKLAAGRSKIITSLLVLAGSAVFYAVLNWLVVGGIGG